MVRDVTRAERTDGSVRRSGGDGLNLRPLVLYHAQCRDGQASAWVASKALPNAELIPVQYGSQPPLELAKGRDVYVIDFSWKRVEMKQLILVSRSTVVLDHHKTAAVELKDILLELQQIDQRQPGDRIVFDMERSGAGISWDYFHPVDWLCDACGASDTGHHEAWDPFGHQPGCPEGRPWVVNYVEDRDLWRWALPSSREVNAYVATLPYDLEALDHIPTRETAIELGKGAQAAVHCYADAVCANAYEIEVGGYHVPSVTACQHNISEVLERLMELTPSAPFVVGWWRRPDGHFAYSLRSKGIFDVSQIAGRYGGGGHQNAAGFQMGELI